MLMWQAPGYRYLWYKLLSHNDGEDIAIFTPEVPCAANDGKNVLVNPDTFFTLGLLERTFVLAHEVQHSIYGDVEFLHKCVEAGKVPTPDGKSLPFEAQTLQIAMDYRINALLVDSKIGKMPKGEWEGFYDVKVATANDGILDVYSRLYKKQEGNKQGNQQGGQGQGQQGQGPGQQQKQNGNPGGGFDKLLPPGKSTGQNPQQAAQERNQQQWQIECKVAQTLEQSKSCGTMSAAMKRMFDEILQPEVYWLDHIRGEIQRKVGSGGRTWRFPDRRFIGMDMYLPGRTGHGAGWIVCWGDTSGSMGDVEIKAYIGELASILEDCRPKRLTMIWNDSRIGYVDELEDAGDLRKVIARGTGGGGGTSVKPVMKWIKEQMDTPELFIGFTDGCLGFPAEPPYPVIWASTMDQKYPYGVVVRINKKSQQQ